jgi:hypothetical protein
MTLLFGNGWNAIQVQRRLSRDHPSFTLDAVIGPSFSMRS